MNKKEMWKLLREEGVTVRLIFEDDSEIEVFPPVEDTGKKQGVPLKIFGGKFEKDEKEVKESISVEAAQGLRGALWGKGNEITLKKTK